MEIFFLVLLFVVMVYALGSGYPVAFALPGAAIITIGLAALGGWLVTGNPDTWFVQGGPVEWLTSGVTNLRSIFWEAERDTLIAIPLFIFMGIMLQRSRIAEDLLITMAQLFGATPGGLGISVVFVGALLAATTGIVGATVVAMGLISLPVMLDNKYSKPLATGTICASGTLGQIIPPSIVLIILADQLANAAGQASAERKALYKEATGEITMPTHLDVISTSAGDMFLGAFLPGLVLVVLYMVYIMVAAWIRPSIAPAVPYEGKRLERDFIIKALLSLLPPLILIFVVLGSIIAGVATVNQAGAIGAIGAVIMAGYRLYEGQTGAMRPVVLALASLLALFILTRVFDLNIQVTQTGFNILGQWLAIIAVGGLCFAILWSLWRIWKTDNTLNAVMLESVKTTSMVFIILLAAAMLTSAFRAFGGEEIVKHFLTGLPGGFWAQFVVVMLVIFLLGFFLDFIEIAVVVVPIVAPILLADPSANITAVWLGVMIGINIQTSFLTPPFGFALFYLRGVASRAVKTLDIYKGVIPFILLQIGSLLIVGLNPPLINYLPMRTYLSSELAPPPKNPRLQTCLEDNLFTYYRDNEQLIMDRTAVLSTLSTQTDTGGIPADVAPKIKEISDKVRAIFPTIAIIADVERQMADAEPAYRAMHRKTRTIERSMRRLEAQRKKIDNSGTTDTRAVRDAKLEAITAEIDALKAAIPPDWEEANQAFVAYQSEHEKQTRNYRRLADDAYRGLVEVIAALKDNAGTDTATLAAPSADPLTDPLTGPSAGPIATLEDYERFIRDTIGLREQEKLNSEQVSLVSACLARHRDISLNF